MLSRIESFARAVLHGWNELAYRAASLAVGAVRYEPGRLLVTGGTHFSDWPEEVSPPIGLGRAARRFDEALDRLALRVGQWSPDVEAFARWLTGAAGGLIDAVSASAVDELVRARLGAGMLKPHPHTVGVVVIDMRGFSRLTVALDDSQYLTERIDEYLSVMTRVVERHRGIVFDYTGDGLLAVFLPELVRKEEAELVDHLAGPLGRDLHTAFRRLAERWRGDWRRTGRTGAEIGFGVGVTYGPATIGLMGPAGKKFFGVVGPPVNLAAYLCSQAPAGTVLIDADSFRRAGAEPPDGHKSVRIRSRKLHQRIDAVRIRPSAVDAA